jgi:hypothetical protein
VTQLAQGMIDNLGGVLGIGFSPEKETFADPRIAIHIRSMNLELSDE